jgi:hypothetical protein
MNTNTALAVCVLAKKSFFWNLQVLSRSGNVCSIIIGLVVRRYRHIVIETYEILEMDECSLEL